MSKEIERKWLVKLTDYLGGGFWQSNTIEQFYVEVSEDREIRYRRKNKNYYRTEKIGKGLTRDENEVEVSEREYDNAKNIKVGNVIYKERFEHEGWELDCYIKPGDHVILEREFIDELEASVVVIPKELEVKVIKDVTNDERYKNKNIAINGFPS